MLTRIKWLRVSVWALYGAFVAWWIPEAYGRALLAVFISDLLSLLLDEYYRR